MVQSPVGGKVLSTRTIYLHLATHSDTAEWDNLQHYFRHQFGRYKKNVANGVPCAYICSTSIYVEDSILNECFQVRNNRCPTNVLQSDLMCSTWRIDLDIVT